MTSTFTFPSWVLMICLLASAVSGCGDDSSMPGKTVSATVSGTVQYEDREYSYSGFTGNKNYKSVRYAVVDLVDARNNIVDTTITDEQGAYELEGQGTNLYVRVMSMTAAAAGSVIEVSNYSGAVYAVRQNVEEDGEVTLDFNISYQDSIAGAFNILDVYTNASLFVGEVSTSPLPPLNVHWQAGSSRYGTYFCQTNYKGGACPLGKGIYLLGGSSSGGDTDEYDDDVLYHEYAHYLEAVYGAQDSPGGRHYLTDNDSDLRLAWSEGLGGFFPGAVKSWLKENNPERLSTYDGNTSTYFIDTVGSTAAISIDMANPSRMFCLWGKDCFVYSSSEVAVAKVLLGLRETFGMQALWSVFSGYLPNSTAYASTLESFWDGWIQQRSPDEQELSLLHTIFEDRLIYYQSDDYESDDNRENTRKLAVCNSESCAGELHYLYNQTSKDVDLISFDAQNGKSYLIETLGLSNGADTYIRITDAMQNTVVDQNGQTMVNNDRPGTVYCYNYDNPCRIHNDDSMLSSALTFTPGQSATYYLEVKTSPSKPAAAGRYGTYTLRILEQ
ncbi:MAG: hypothetical protein PVF82_04060 [Gammaproteobacteria bacterium]|jgi:hypothetical protein